MRKEDKLRPYRVDFFDIEEMKDNDLALVRSQVVRAVTAVDAVYEVVDKPELNTTGYPSLILIRSYRFYKNLVHKKDVYKPVEDLFTANKAVEIMNQVEAYRAKRKASFMSNEAYGSPSVSAPGHVTRYSDSSLYDEVCVNCGATDTSGKLDQPCPSAPVAPVVVPVPVAAVETPAPTTGPDSPATVAVVADLQGMLAHDAHEQAMDTFKPESVPEGKRFPDPTNAPITLESVPMKEHDLLNPVVENCPQCGAQPTAGRAPTSWTLGMGAPVVETPIEPDQAVGCGGRPEYLNAPPPPLSSLGFPLWAKLLLFTGALAVILYTLLHTR
jgi:hypothetical protein